VITVKKFPSERFVLKSDDPHWWANITVTPDGFLDIQSDYGSYSYYWHSFGENFKAFLSTCDHSYLIGKFGKGRTQLNPGATIARVKKDVIELRKNRTIDSGQARDLWNQADLLESNDVNSFYMEMDPRDFDSSQVCLIRTVYDNDYSSIPIVMEDDPATCAFMEKVWPHFIEEIKKV
jgi:hypothetical protein